MSSARRSLGVPALGRSSGPIPERTGDGAHEHRAIARKLGQPARVERPLRARLVAAGQCCAAIARDRRAAQSFVSVPCSRLPAATLAQAAPYLAKDKSVHAIQNLE